MAQVTVVQKTNSTTGGASLTGVVSGRMLVAVVHAFRFFGSTPVFTAVSGGGATWTKRIEAAGAERGVATFTGAGGTGGSITVTATGTWDGYAVTLYELDANASAYDVGAGASGSGTSASSGSTATLASDEDLAIGGFACISQYLDYTMTGGFTEDSDFVPGEDYRFGASHLQVTATTGLAATATISGSAEWSAAIVTIKPAGGGGGTNPKGIFGLPLRGPLQRVVY